MSGLSLNVSEGEIRNAIAVGIAEAFGPEKRDALLRDIVRAHLQHRENSYDKETILSKSVGQQIRNMAMEVLTARIEEWRLEIERIVADSLGPQFKESVFAQLKTALAHVVVRNISLNVDLE